MLLTYTDSNERDKKLNKKIMKCQLEIDKALKNNFDYPAAMKNVFGVFSTSLGNTNTLAKQTQNRFGWIHK